MNNKVKTKLNSEEFREYDEGNVAEVLYDLGFRTVENILDMRIYDLMNMNRMSRNRVESILYSLYQFLNPNLDVDEAVYNGMMKQPFDYREWRKTNGKHHKVLVRELILASGMNEKALFHLINIIVRAFFKSEEYNSREYAYYDFDDYINCMEGGRG